MEHGQASRFEFPQPDGSSILAHRFVNPDGSIGGWVADDALIEDGAFIATGAVVFPKTHVRAGEHIKPGTIVSVEEIDSID